MKNRNLLSLVLLCVACAGAACSSPVKSPAAPQVVLQGESSPMPLDDVVAKKPLTVLLFFTSECPVQRAHDQRVRELMTHYEPQVTFVAVASEVGADMPAEREDAKRRLALSVLEDKNAALADALSVEYSTHAVLLDKNRRVLYSGAFDSDRSHLTDGADRYLQHAIEDALADRPVKKAKTEALGCPLRKH